MSEFEFIAVFISIIFGLALTQMLSGMLTLIQRDELTEIHFGWTCFILYLLVMAWWTFYPWSTHSSWQLEHFFIVICWALAHYVMASTLYPARSLEGYDFQSRRRVLLCAFLVAAALDLSQTALRGGFFEPWYYWIFIVFMMLLVGLGLLAENEKLHRFIPWMLLTSILTWTFVVRRILS